MLRPSSSDLDLHVGVIMLGSKDIPAGHYEKHWNEVQKRLEEAAQMGLFVAISSFEGDVANLESTRRIVNDAYSAIIDAGLEGNATIYLAGHLVGGSMIQKYALVRDSSAPFVPSGLILLGSFMERNSLSNIDKLPKRSLTFAAELDGVIRITRHMEQFYKLNGDVSNNPSHTIVVIEGASHSQFFQGKASESILSLDFQPEVPDESVLSEIADTITKFISVEKDHLRRDSLEMLASYNAKTSMFFQPLVKSFKLEGFYFFDPPCNEAQPGTKCTYGSPWVSDFAQKILAGVGDKVMSVDRFWQTDMIFPHDYIPQLKKICSLSGDCFLNATSYTTNRYASSKGLDLGSSVSASTKIVTKLNSREQVFKTLGLNESHSAAQCMEINEAALSWALKHAGSTALKRYNNFGQKLRMRPDHAFQWNYPSWDLASIEMKANAATGEIDVVSQSVNFDSKILGFGGLFYCNLMSPARIMEWIYIDSLRNAYALSSTE